jgi:hypothetical protein
MFDPALHKLPALLIGDLEVLNNTCFEDFDFILSHAAVSRKHAITTNGLIQ